MIRLIILLLLVLHPVWIGAYDTQANPAAANWDDEDQEVKNLAKVQEDAAEYRLARDRAKPDAAYEAQAAEYLTESNAILTTGTSQHLEGWYYWMFSTNRRARWLAIDGFKARPYSRVAGDLMATAISAYARAGDMGGLYRQLAMLWYYLPDYANLKQVMETAQTAAERTQAFESAVNLEADKPSEVIRLDSDGTLNDVVRLYRFHAMHGDRETVAPRAALGLARALMTIKGAKDVWQARREYERFLDTYTNHPLTFNALCEQALCYLISYQGKDYDVGVLLSAVPIIDQAEVEARGNSEKLLKVEAYRKRIRSWLQDRDLMVARWYAERVPPFLAFVMRPGEGPDSWNRGARTYFQQVVKRDSGTTQGRAAARELERLPPAPVDVLSLPRVKTL